MSQLNQMSQKNRLLPKNVFIWDLDDTLVWTSWAYSRAFAKFYEYMLQLFDYRLIELRTLGTISEEIDKTLIQATNQKTAKPYGHSMERFPESLVETYKWLCKHDYGKYQEMVARRVRIIGMEAFDPLGYKQQGLVRGAENTLNFIKNQGDVQILITKGERLVQEYKIVSLELERWFDKEIYIVDRKTKEIFQEHCKRFTDSTVYSVGNSYKSDIVPALDAGAMGVLIPYYTWLGEELSIAIDTRRVYKIENVEQVISLYKERDF